MPAPVPAASQEPAPAVPFDHAEAARLLADLRQAVAEAEANGPGGKFKPQLGQIVADGLAIAEGYVTNHAREAARGWDPLALLRGVKPHLLSLIARNGHKPARRGLIAKAVGPWR